jgi:hypothetical protein
MERREMRGGGSQAELAGRSRIALRSIRATAAAQYFLNSPTILPWIFTRLGGRMRTS